MIIFNENSVPILIDNIDIPILVDHYWVLDLEQRDFTITPLKMNEEITTPILTIVIGGTKIDLPASWNILIFSEETFQLDIASVSDLTRNNFSALVYNIQKHKAVAAPIHVVDYKMSGKVHTPSLHKTHMLCTAIGSKEMVCISPTDNYNKYLKNATVSDILY